MPYKPAHFSLDELVDKDTLDHHGDNAWKLLDPDLLRAIDVLREIHGKPITCNDWAIGGIAQWRGYRTKYCRVGTPGSMHRIGMAFDLTLHGLTGEQARDLVRKAHKDAAREIQAIRRIESGVSWLHIDSKPSGMLGLIEFDPGHRSETQELP